MNNNAPISDLEEKIRNTEQALSKAREQENDGQILSNLRKLGQLHLDNGDAPQALTQYDEALKLGAKSEDKEAHAHILGFRGLALKLIGNFSLALQASRKSNALASELGHAQLTIAS